MNRIGIGLGALLLGALPGCHDDALSTARDPLRGSNSAHDGGTAPATGDDAPPETRDDGDRGHASGEEELLVSLEASRPMVCPGECLTLTARLAGETPSAETYALAWADTAEPAGPEREVCPTGSTTYHVDVHERSEVLGEFARDPRTGSADVTVSVTSDCTDAGDAPSEVDVGCSYRIPVAWPNKGIVALHGEVKQDAHGNMYLAAGFTGKVSIAGKVFGADTIFESGNWDVLLAKFDTTCKLLWAKQLETDAMFTTLDHFAVGPDGSMALLAWDKSYDFFFNEVIHHHLYVLDANGNQKRVEDASYGTPSYQALNFGPNGLLAVPGLPNVDQQRISVLNADGSLHYGIAVHGRSVGVAFDHASNLLIAGLGGWNGGTVFSGLDAHSSDTTEAYAAVFAPGGSMRWARYLPVPRDQFSSIEARAVFLDNGDILSPRTSVDPEGQHLHVWRLNAAGDTQEVGDFVQPREAGWMYSLWPLGDGTYAVLAAQPTGEKDHAGNPIERTLLQHRKADGTLLYQHDETLQPYSTPGGIALGPQGALSFTLGELTHYSEETAVRGRTTALIVRRHPGFPSAP